MGAVFDVFRQPEFVRQLLVHIELFVLALVIGTAIALPVALAVRNTTLGTVLATNIGNFGRAIPALALLALAFPIFGFGIASALVALAALAVPPILINATVGLREVDRQVMDAARGMGLSEAQILTRVQLPIAAPVLFAGIRTSAVQSVANATLATFIGGGGLGNLIVVGYQADRLDFQIAGALAVAVLAIATEIGFGALERAFTPRGLQLARKGIAKD